jgi:hypothetical protein
MWGQPFNQFGGFPRQMMELDELPDGYEHVIDSYGRPQFDQFGRPVVRKVAQERQPSDQRRSVEHVHEQKRASVDEKRPMQKPPSPPAKSSQPPPPPVSKAEPIKAEPAKPVKKSYAQTLRDTLTPEELVEKRAQSAKVLQKNLDQLSQNRATRDILKKLAKLGKMEKAFNDEVTRHERSVFQIPLTFEDNYKRVIPNRFNRPFLQYEDALQKMLLSLDEVGTGGHDFVRERRKALVAKVQMALDRVDQRRREEEAARKEEIARGLPGPELPSRSPSRSPPPEVSAPKPEVHADKLQPPARSKVESIPIEVENVEIKPPTHQPHQAHTQPIQASPPVHAEHDGEKKKKKNRRRKSKNRQGVEHGVEQASESDGSDNVPEAPRRPAEAAHQAAAHVAQQARPHYDAAQHAPTHHAQTQPVEHRQEETRRSREEPRTVRMHPQYGPYIINEDNEPVLVELRQLPDGRQVCFAQRLFANS